MTSVGPARARAEIDLAAYAGNVRSLRARIGTAQLMCVVKADAYGHGAVACARVARAAGADWLGVAFVDEALALRAAGDRGPLLAWLLNEHDDVDAAIAADIDLSVSNLEQLRHVIAASQRVGVAPRIHIELDTGLSRGGAAPAEWPALFAEASPHLVVSLWSHLACADQIDHPSIDAQRDTYLAALDLAADMGVRPLLRHLANSAATLTRPDLHFDLVRVGMASYGVSPMDDAATDYDLAPVMTVHATVAQVRDVPAGAGVSYGHRYVAEQSTTLALLPLGYADGVPRAATNVAEVTLAAQRLRIAGTVCMDQFVIDVGAIPVAVGDDVILFGAGGATASDWARACGTIGYEITTRIGDRLAKTFVGGA